MGTGSERVLGRSLAGRGEELAKALGNAYALPADVVAAAKETMGEK